MESIHSTNALPLVSRRNKLFKTRGKSKTKQPLIYNTEGKESGKRQARKTGFIQITK